ncbi:DUF4181 domain-containing protein [Oceanobacillus sp. CAU 1775]
MYYTLGTDFWGRLILLLAIVGLLLFTFNFVMRKILKVERPEFFSYNHINDKHKRIDWTIRISFFILLLLGFTINVMREPHEIIAIFEPYNLLVFFIVASEGVRAYMEWKYAENRNAYIFTISQLVFAIILLITFFIIIDNTNFFGWFE